MHIAVAGGGIAGLTAALALAARGFSVSLFERATRLEEVGAGIQLSPNAMAVLQRLGVMQALEGRLSEPEALVIRSAQSGAAIARLPLGKTARERYGAPYCTLHRADLQDALVATARQVLAISFDLGAEVAEIRAEDDGVAFSAGGLERKADVLVAADGIHSRVRTGYFGHPGPVPFGRSAWRATLLASKVAGLVPLDVTGLWLGAGIHLVHYPVRRRREPQRRRYRARQRQGSAGRALRQCRAARDRCGLRMDAVAAHACRRSASVDARTRGVGWRRRACDGAERRARRSAGNRRCVGAREVSGRN